MRDMEYRSIPQGQTPQAYQTMLAQIYFKQLTQNQQVTHPSEFKSPAAVRSVREQAMKQYRYKADQGDASTAPTRE
jgi:hypothetical protein